MVRNPILGVLILSSLLSGCAASRSPIEGLYGGSPRAEPAAAKVSVLFLIRHLEQQHGFDAIPKLQTTPVNDFDNLFRDALGELGNLGRYETFTELPNDVNDPKRREQLESARAAADYVVALDFFEETAFVQQFVSGMVSLVSLTAIPMPYDWNYTFSARVAAKDGARVGAYERRATLSDWVQVFLIVVYPFHPIELKREQIFSESMHDIFRQIEAERVLK